MINNSKLQDIDNILISGTAKNSTQNYMPKFGIKGSDNLGLYSDVFKHDNNNDDIKKLKEKFEEIQNKQGYIGKAWNAIKKIFGGGSKKVENAILKCERGEISVSEAQSVLNKYQKGQKTCVDVAADMISAIASIFVYNTAIPKDKASVVIGFTASTITGAGVKTGIKATDAAVGKREYTKKELITDAATGAMNGLMGPLSNALGAKATEKLGNKFGLEVVTNGVKSVNKSGIKDKIKNILTTQSVDVKGGTIVKRTLALGAGMAIDGALSGASDNMLRAAIDGDNVLEAGIQGAIGGGLAAPVIGGGFRIASNAGKSFNNKIITKHVLKNGMNTTFSQGNTGDCSLLTIIDGIMNNPNSQKKVKNAITKSAAGDYYVKIGDRTVQVAKGAITDEMLSDVTGIRIFEQAYKQIAGDIDGGFAEIVAKQFGLNPVHITSDLITDEMLDTLSREQKNTVLALGFNVDDFGQISQNGTNKHYFNIREIDTNTKTVKVTNPYDTSQVIELSFDTVKKSAISIDGGSINETSLPNALREAGEATFKGINVDDTVKALKLYLTEQGIDVDRFNQAISKKIPFSDKPFDITDFASMLKNSGISADDISEFLLSRSGKNLSIEEKVSDLVKSVSKYKLIKDNHYLQGYNLSLTDIDLLQNALKDCDIDNVCEILRRNNSKYFESVGGEDYILNNILDMEMALSDSSIPFGIYTKPSSLMEFPVEINGKKKFFIFNSGTSIVKSKHSVIDYITLFKSNMITTDALDIADKLGILPSQIDIKINGVKGFNTKGVKVTYNTSDLLSKIKNNGIDSLSSREVHALTDLLKNLYENPKIQSKFEKALSKELKSKCSSIYDVVDYLRKNSQNSLKGTNVEISDHAFMRMIDRNLTTTVNNSTGEVLDFNKFIKLLADNASNGTTSIKGFEGSNGINMILRNENGKIIIDSIM